MPNNSFRLTRIDSNVNYLVKFELCVEFVNQTFSPIVKFLKVFKFLLVRDLFDSRSILPHLRIYRFLFLIWSQYQLLLLRRYSCVAFSQVHYLILSLFIQHYSSSNSSVFTIERILECGVYEDIILFRGSSTQAFIYIAVFDRHIAAMFYCLGVRRLPNQIGLAFCDYHYIVVIEAGSQDTGLRYILYLFFALYFSSIYPLYSSHGF